MKPAFKLTKKGDKIFKEILSHLKDLELKEIDSLELTTLANAFALHFQAAEDMNLNGYKQETKTGYSQVKADFTLYQKTWDITNKMSDKFGLNPAAREKIKLFIAEEKDELSEV